MVVLIVTAVRPGLRGELSRWMIEPQAGTFVGNVPARVRDRLWDKVVREVKEGSAVLLFSARTERRGSRCGSTATVGGCRRTSRG